MAGQTFEGKARDYGKIVGGFLGRTIDNVSAAIDRIGDGSGFTIEVVDMIDRTPERIRVDDKGDSYDEVLDRVAKKAIAKIPDSEDAAYDIYYNDGGAVIAKRDSFLIVALVKIR